MDKIVRDDLPGAGPSRTNYLEGRMDRVFGVAGHLISSVELEVAREPGSDGHHVAQLLVMCANGTPLHVVSRRRLLPDALANAFDAAESKMNTALKIPQMSDEDELGPHDMPLPSVAGRRRTGSSFVPRR